MRGELPTELLTAEEFQLVPTQLSPAKVPPDQLSLAQLPSAHLRLAQLASAQLPPTQLLTAQGFQCGPPGLATRLPDRCSRTSK